MDISSYKSDFDRGYRLVLSFWRLKFDGLKNTCRCYGLTCQQRVILFRQTQPIHTISFWFEDDLFCSQPRKSQLA
jgi:hypothetical protein